MIKRERYMGRIRPFMGTDLVKVLTGIRRCGKSVMLALIREELVESGVDPARCIAINFEDMRNAGLCTARALHEDILRRTAGMDGKVYLFFDEIQEVEGWETCINSLRVEMDCDIYITGSNARLLSGELATYLAGRYVEFVIYPFSFGEFVELYRTVRPGADMRACFQRYLTAGGMPYLAHLQYEEEPCRQYLQDLFRSVELKDIVQRCRVRDVDMLERLLRYVTAHIGTTFSSRSISRYLKSEGRTVSPETVMTYLRACGDAFLLYPVRRQDLQGKKILTVNEKYYVADHGIREAVLGGNARDIQLVLENMVFLELLRRGWRVSVGKAGEQEIDFVCEAGGQRCYIQVAYLLASEDTIGREFGVYRHVQDHYPKYVLSLDEFDMSRDGIIHQNIRDFLLSEDGPATRGGEH